ncbi:MAG: sulfotransferase domain-containing protein [Planctomycetota bacterium]
MLESLKKMLGVASTAEQRTITVVSGLPRSGTSLMMQMLEAGGLPPLTDGQRERDEDNPKGYYEFQRVKKLDEGDTAWLPQARGRAVKVVSALLPHLPVNYQYQVLFMRRQLQEVLASQEKMLGRRGEEKEIDDEEMEQLYRKHLRETREWLESRSDVRSLEVDFNELVTDPAPVVRQVVSFLDADLDADAMTSVVDPDLYRNRA